MELFGKRVIIISVMIIILSFLDFLDQTIVTLLNFKDEGTFELTVDFVSPIIEVCLMFWALVTGKEILRKQHEEEQTYERLIQFSPEAIIVHVGGKILYINESGVKLLGSSNSSELINRDIKDFVHTDSVEDFKNLNEQTNILNKRNSNHHLKIKRVDGAIIDLMFSSSKINFKGHSAREIIARDITVQKKNADDNKRLAYQDTLTGLPNRRAFFDNLTHLVASSDKNNSEFGIMFIDLDGFKQVNDSLGHDGGDILLKHFGDCLIKSVAQTGSVARLAGDEFVVLLPKANENKCIIVANKIIESLQDPINIFGKLIKVTPSIGIALYPQHGNDPHLLMKYADIAMYHAKQSGKNNYQIYVDLKN